MSHHQPSSSVKAEAFAASDASRQHHHHDENQREIIVIDDTDEESLGGADAEETTAVDVAGHQTAAAAIAAVSFQAPQCEQVGSSMIVANKEDRSKNEIEESSESERDKGAGVTFAAGDMASKSDIAATTTATATIKEEQSRNEVEESSEPEQNKSTKVTFAAGDMESKSDIAATKVADAVIAERPPNKDCVIPKSQDVLFGRGGMIRHPGNRLMLDLIDENLIEYFESSRERKRFIAEEIISKLSHKGGRFLRRGDNEDTDSVWWIEVPKEDAYEKVCRAFSTKKNSQKKDAPGNQGSNTIVLTTHSPVQQYQQYQEMRGDVSLHQGTQIVISESAQQQTWNNNHRSTSIVVSPPHQRRGVISTTPILPAASLTEGQKQPQSRLAVTAPSSANTSKHILVKRSPNEYHPKTPDVLFGRATPYRTHPGNQRMMSLVNSYMSEYSKHHLDNEKKRYIIEKIIDLITRGGGRFLRRNFDNGNGNSIAYWAEVSEQEAYDKVRKAFKTSKSNQAEYKRSHQTANSTATNTENVVTIHPTDLDVIFQQGSSFRDHRGNQMLLYLVEKNRNEYFELPNGDSRKRSILEGIVDKLTRDGGRFLRRHQFYGELTWTEVSKPAAIEKVRSSFNHKRPSLDQEVSQNAIPSNSSPNYHNQQLGIYSSNEETVVNHVATESEYEKLEVVMDMLRRVHLFDENFSQPTYILYPEVSVDFSFKVNCCKITAVVVYSL
jgi:hypothetical protein